MVCLDEEGVRWKTLNCFRMTEDDDGTGSKEWPPPSAVTVVIGVRCDVVAEEDARRAAFKCLDVLKEFDITDVDVQISEMRFWGSLALWD